MCEHEHSRDHHQKEGDNPIERLRPEAGSPAGAQPGAEQASEEKVSDHRPMLGYSGPRNRCSSKRQRRRHDYEAHRLVEDDGFECYEAKHANQDRQSKLRAAEANDAAERPNHGPGRERSRKSVGCGKLLGAVRHVCLP